MPPLRGAGKRSSLALETKLKILEEIDKKRFSKSDIAIQFNIPKSTLFTILKNRDTISKACKSGVAPDRIRVRDSKHPQLEEALVKWMKHVRATNIPIDGNILKSKAETFALQMKIEDFKASDGWVQNFKSRHGLSFRKVCGESAAVNPETVNEWREKKLKTLIADYDPDDVFNADETGLFFKLLPDRTFVFKGEECSGGKKAKQRVTALLATNMSGSEKLPLLIIGKAQKPRCFKGIRSLPIIYKANKKAWMVSQIFEEWVRVLDRKMAAKGRKILLVIDNCTAHPEISNLSAVTIAFLPPNVTSVLQPLDQGIIQSFKKHYRRMLLSRVVLCLDSGKTYEVDLLGAIHLANAAWKAVTQETIQHCFRHAGFKAPTSLAEADQAVTPPPFPTTEEHPDDDGDLLIQKVRERCGLPEGLRFADYASIDDNVTCTENLTDEELISQILSGADNNAAEVSSDEEEMPEPQPKPTAKQASDAVSVLRCFFEQADNSEKHLSALMEMEEIVLKSQVFKQKDITDFFRKQ